MIKICMRCNKQFKTSHKQTKYCSKECDNIVRKGKHFSPNTQFKKGAFPWNKGKHPKCFQGKNHPMWGRHHSEETKEKIRKIHKDKLGEKSYNWKGGIFKRRGYVYVYFPNHPNNHEKYILKHRLIMENKLGRYLTKNEIVHHKNGNKLDNRIENLKLFKNKSEHTKFHFLNNSLGIKRKLSSPII